MSPARVNLEVMITGYDPETLRERVDRAAVESRLVEIGNGRSNHGSREKAELARLLGRHGEHWWRQNTPFDSRISAGIHPRRGRLDRALAEMTAVRAQAALEEWHRSRVQPPTPRVALSSSLGRYTESREAFTAALDIRTGSGPGGRRSTRPASP
jgi:hypothetical protein